jgi:hypothetical protein
MPAVNPSGFGAFCLRLFLFSMFLVLHQPFQILALLA